MGIQKKKAKMHHGNAQEREPFGFDTTECFGLFNSHVMYRL